MPANASSPSPTPPTNDHITATPPRPPSPLPGTELHQWHLRPDVAFLHHGSFGATPRVVLDAQSRYRTAIEAEPIETLGRRCADLLAPAKQSVGDLLGMQPDDFGFVTNATTGVNAVLRSLHFEPGDELVTTNHVYNAVRQAMKHTAHVVGATMIEARVPMPIVRPEQVTAAIESALTDRTRLVIIDHVTSPTALIFPVADILALCAARGIDVLIDGAHAPGMIDLDVASLDAAYYAANLHKWLCAPKGAAFLWVRPDKQPDIHPLTISHWYDQGIAAEFNWQGTADITPWQASTDAISFLSAYGWDALRSHNHQLAVWAQYELCRRWNVEPATPSDGSMLGSMVTVPLPLGGPKMFESAEAMQQRLYDDHRVEAPIIDFDGNWWTRISCMIYTRPADIERLADAVPAMLG